MSDKKIIITIPTYNAERYIKKLVKELRSQTIAPIITIIDSSSEDKTYNLLGSLSVETIKIAKKDFNHAITRNMALNYDADFYLFMTQDALPYDSNLIKNLIKPFDDKSIVVSYARQMPYENADAIERFARNTNYPEVSSVKSKDNLSSLGIKTFFCSNSCAMYRASYFKEVGGFTDGLNTNEDMEFAARAIMAGKKIAYAAEAKVWHSHTQTAKDLYKRYKNIGQFFSENSWILDEVNKHSSAESTGIKQAKKELKHLLKYNPILIPKSILFSLVKYIGFRNGKNN